jgi:hypothetical protein
MCATYSEFLRRGGLAPLVDYLSRVLTHDGLIVWNRMWITFIDVKPELRRRMRKSEFYCESKYIGKVSFSTWQHLRGSALLHKYEGFVGDKYVPIGDIQKTLNRYIKTMILNADDFGSWHDYQELINGYLERIDFSTSIHKLLMFGKQTCVDAKSFVRVTSRKNIPKFRKFLKYADNDDHMFVYTRPAAHFPTSMKTTFGELVGYGELFTSHITADYSEGGFTCTMCKDIIPVPHTTRETCQIWFDSVVMNLGDDRYPELLNCKGELWVNIWLEVSKGQLFWVWDKLSHDKERQDRSYPKITDHMRNKVAVPYSVAVSKKCGYPCPNIRAAIDKMYLNDPELYQTLFCVKFGK